MKILALLTLASTLSAFAADGDVTVAVNGINVGNLSSNQWYAVTQVASGVDPGTWLFGKMSDKADNCVQSVRGVNASLISSTVNGLALQDQTTLATRLSDYDNLTSILGTTPVTPLPVPVIVQQPTDQYVYNGSNASFTTIASGKKIGYQWQFYNTNLLTASATKSTLHVNNAKPAKEGPYSCIVTNPWGSVTSAVAMLTINTNTPAVVTNAP